MRLILGGDSEARDRRAQALQLGALLLFAIAVINLSLYQVFVVPDQNAEIEFKHNQQVQDQMENVRGTLLRTSTTGSDLSASVQMGPQYPSRTLFVNPGPPSGALRTNDLGTMEVANAEAIGPETSEVWNGSTRSFGTSRIVYQPGYNVYANAPETVYENSVVYNDFSPNGNDRRLSLTGQSVVNGKRLALVALSGRLSTSSTGSESLDFEPISAPSRTVAVGNTAAGDPVTIRVPTYLSESEWEDLLASEIDDSPDAGADDRYVSDLQVVDGPSGEEYDTLVLTMEEDVTYDLRLAKVGVGSGAADTSATYVVRSDPGTQSVTVSEGTTREFVVEVRDEYDNPTSGVEVTADDPAGLGSLSSTSARTDADGLATFEYDAAGTGTETLTFQFDDGGTDRKEVQYDVTVTDPDGSDTGTGDGSGGDGSQFGTGGESTYDGENPTQTVSVRNGQLTGITSTDELILSGAVPTVDSNDGKDRLEYETTLDNGTTTYTVRLRLIKGLSAEDWNTRSVTIFDDTGNSQSATLTKEAAAGINGSQTAYNGTDLLDVNNVAYNDPGSSFNRSAAEVRGMDDDGDTTVTALTTSIDGRVNSTIREEALFSAAQSQPSDGNDYEFVRVNFETPTNTTGWEIRYEEGSGTTTLPKRGNVGALSGEIYFAADESAFENERGLDDDVVYPLETSLQDADNLTLVDSSGDRRDELAFEADSDGSPDTTNGWTVSDLGSGEVAVRKTIGEPYQDADRASDWRITTQRNFFGPSRLSVAFVPNSNQRLIRTVTPDGTVVDYGEDPSQIKILGPKTDLDDEGQDEVLYIGGSNGQSLRYMESDGSITTLVGSKVKQSSAIGVGDPDGGGMKTVYYAVSNGNKLKKIEVGGSPERVSGSGNSAVSAKGVVGVDDVDDDNGKEIIYLPSDTSKEIGYVDVDGGPTTTTRIGPPGNRYQIGNGNAVGEPVKINGNLRVPIVNGSQDLLLVDPTDGSTFETVNRGSVKPKKNPITVLDWDGDDTKEILVINGNDNQHLYYIEVNIRDETDTIDTGEVRDEQADQKGVR